MTGKEIVEALGPEECLAILREARGQLQDNDCGTWSQEARDWAVGKGLIQGGGDDNFMWEDLLTREQMAVLLYRFAKLMGQA
jgi:hypothetical protein